MIRFLVIVMTFTYGCTDPEVGPSVADQSTADAVADVGPVADAAAPLPMCEKNPNQGPIAGACLELWTARRVRGADDCAPGLFTLGPPIPEPDAAVPMPDAGGPADAMAAAPLPPGDAGVSQDAMGFPDGGGGPDAAIGADARTPADAGTVLDGAQAVDGGPSLDMESAPDAALPIDAALSVDGDLPDAAQPMPPASCLNADVRACGCQAALTGEILSVTAGPPSVGCPLASIWDEAGGEVTQMQIAFEGDTIGILAVRADSLGLLERLQSLGAGQTVSLAYARDADGGILLSLSHDDQTLMVVRAGGAFSDVQLSPGARLGASDPRCSDGAETCPSRRHDLLFLDGNAPYVVPTETVDEVGGWRIAPYRLSSVAEGPECGAGQSHFGALRLGD